MNFHLNVILPAMKLTNSSDYRRIKRSISCLKDSKIQGLGSEFRIQDSEIWDPDLADPLRSLHATVPILIGAPYRITQQCV